MTMLMEKNPVLDRCVNQLYEAIKESAYNTKYSWDQLKSLAGLRSMKQETLYYVVNKVCLLMMANNQRYLVTECKYGKRVILPSEHGIAAHNTIKKSARVYRKAGAIIASTNMEELSEAERNDIIDRANRYSTLEAFSNEILRRKRVGVDVKESARMANVFLDAVKLFTRGDEKQSN